MPAVFARVWILFAVTSVFGALQCIPEEFIKQALLPAPLGEVKGITVDRRAHEAEVRVPAAVMPRFLGKAGLNVAVAGRVTGFSIRLASL